VSPQTYRNYSQGQESDTHPWPRSSVCRGEVWRREQEDTASSAYLKPDMERIICLPHNCQFLATGLSLSLYSCLYAFPCVHIKQPYQHHHVHARLTDLEFLPNNRPPSTGNSTRWQCSAGMGTWKMTTMPLRRIWRQKRDQWDSFTLISTRSCSVILNPHRT